MELYLIRHAQSANNALPEPERVPDPGITELGIRQALALGDRLRDARIDVLLTSAFRRALQTTRAVSASRSQEPEIWTDLFEQGGCYDGHEEGKLRGAPGMNRAEISADFPGFKIPEDIGDEGWWRSRTYETWDEAIQRGKRQVARLIREFGDTDQCIACVIHADIKSMMVDELLGQSLQLANRLRNTGVSHFVIRDRKVEKTLLDDVSHLPKEMIT